MWAHAPYGNLKSKSLFAMETRSRDQLCSVILDSVGKGGLGHPLDSACSDQETDEYPQANLFDRSICFLV